MRRKFQSVGTLRTPALHFNSSTPWKKIKENRFRLRVAWKLPEVNGWNSLPFPSSLYAYGANPGRFSRNTTTEQGSWVFPLQWPWGYPWPAEGCKAMSRHPLHPAPGGPLPPAGSALLPTRGQGRYTSSPGQFSCREDDRAPAQLSPAQAPADSLHISKSFPEGTLLLLIVSEYTENSRIWG